MNGRNAKIYGGDEASAHSWPWQVAVIDAKTGGDVDVEDYFGSPCFSGVFPFDALPLGDDHVCLLNNLQCGATLISPTCAITAAHCDVVG